MYLYLVIILLIGLSAYLWREKNRLALSENIAPVREYRRRYKEIFDNTSDAILIIEVTESGQFSIDSFNAATAQIIDLFNVDIVGQSLNDIYASAKEPELQRIVLELSAHLIRAVDSGMPQKYESIFRFATKDIPDSYEISLLPMAADGGITHIFCFAKDITAIKLNEQDLLERVQMEEKLSGFAASAPGFFYSFRHGADGSNAMPFASAGINDLFGLYPEDVAQNISPMSLLIHPDDLKSFFDATANSAATLSSLEIEFRAQHPVKGELWVELRAMPLSMPDGSVLWHGFMHDVTERRLIELHLKDTKNKLHELVLSREIVREDERKRIAWEMHEELGQLLAAMKMRIYGMRTHLPKNVPSLNEDGRVISSLIDKSIKTIHDIVSDLRPTVLQLGLEAGLEWLVDEFIKQADIDCKLEIKGNGALVSEELTTLVFRVVQETLQYIERFSDVSSVAVAWESNQEKQILTIRHDGAAIIDEKSLSIFSIQERVNSFGGAMQMYSDFAHVAVIEITFAVRGVEEIQ